MTYDPSKVKGSDSFLILPSKLGAKEKNLRIRYNSNPKE
jgi:hypothetical protein